MSDNVCANNEMHLNCETDVKKEKHRRTVYNLSVGGLGYTGQHATLYRTNGKNSKQFTNGTRLMFLLLLKKLCYFGKESYP
jgi:hypothetical protein